jgi:hypothetical protein
MAITWANIQVARRIAVEQVTLACPTRVSGGMRYTVYTVRALPTVAPFAHRCSFSDVL